MSASFTAKKQAYRRSVSSAQKGKDRMIDKNKRQITQKEIDDFLHGIRELGLVVTDKFEYIRNFKGLDRIELDLWRTFETLKRINDNFVNYSSWKNDCDDSNQSSSHNE